MADQREADGEIEVKKSLVTERLQKRDEERLSNIQNRKTAKQVTVLVEETTDFFKKEFDRLKTDIERSLAESDAIPVSERPNHFDAVTVSVQKLQKLITDSIQFLQRFNVQKAQDDVNMLKNLVEEKRATVLPKKKFAFRSDKKKTSVAGCDKVDAPAEPVKVKTTILSESDVCGFTNFTDELLCKSREEITSRDVTLSSLVNCTVRLFGSPTALHVNNLVNCKIFCGPISGSAFVDGCRGCIFVLPCQQLRVHTTTETEFYLHVTSRAIIEDCNTVSFAPYNWLYDQIEEDYKLSGLDCNRNNWNDVDDFNWLASGVRSPNWSLIEESKLVLKWN